MIDKSTDLYDGRPNDPMSDAQLSATQFAIQNIPRAVGAAPSKPAVTEPAMTEVSTPVKPTHIDHLSHLKDDDESTPRSSPAGSPQPDETATPAARDATPLAGASNGSASGPQPDSELVDRTVPVMPLDQAILLSINEGAKGDERKTRDFLGGIMVIGGGSKTYNFNVYLEQRLRALQPNYQKEILIGPPPRDLDPQVLVWKGGSVFGKLRGTNDSWIGRLEYDRLGARILNYKCMWAW